MNLKSPAKKDVLWDPISIIKGRLLDTSLFFGALFASIVFIFAFFLSPTYLFSLGFYIDTFSILCLFGVHFFRHRLGIEIRISAILLFVFMLFMVNIFQYGNTSTQKALVTLIPFLSILVFDIRKTIILFAITIGFYCLAAYLFLTKTLVFVPPFPENESISTWVVSVMVTGISGIIIMLLVNRYNNEISSLVKNLQATTSKLEVRDKQRKEHLEEKNIMIQEIHHRVKNNLAVVSGLLELQMRAVGDEKLNEAMQKSANRIMSIAKVHQMLYQSEDFNKIPFKQYVDELADVILGNMNSEMKHIDFQNQVDVAYLSINHGVPLGIIFNELITNSIKYAFKDSDKNKILITVSEKDNRIHVCYRDNGPGIENFKTASTKSLGFSLINSLLAQIDAEKSFHTDEEFRLDFSFPAGTS